MYNHVAWRQLQISITKMSQANLVNSNLIGFAQADSFFKDALKLYKEKQYEEAALHFVEASKHGGLGGGEAEYYAGHIYYDKLDNIAEAEKYLRMAFEKKHILPTRYLDLVTNPTPSNRQGNLFSQNLFDYHHLIIISLLSYNIQAAVPNLWWNYRRK